MSAPVSTMESRCHCLHICDAHPFHACSNLLWLDVSSCSPRLVDQFVLAMSKRAEHHLLKMLFCYLCVCVSCCEHTMPMILATPPHVLAPPRFTTAKLAVANFGESLQQNSTSRAAGCWRPLQAPCVLLSLSDDSDIEQFLCARHHER